MELSASMMRMYPLSEYINGTKTPEHRGYPPRPHLNYVEHDNPDGVWLTVERASKPMVTKAQSPSGRMRVQEAKAASR
jgi:hypothetical protein